MELKALFQFTIFAKMAMPDLQPYNGSLKSFIWLKM